MLPDRRAVVFDLDDTLYPFAWYVRSGFASIATHLQRCRHLDPARTFRILMAARRGETRGRELQHLIATLRLSDGLLPVLMELMRGHQPRLRLPRPSTDVLRRLRADGWRLGILTNGPAPLQARKVAALRIAPLVDTVVYARQFGNGLGKPDPAAFAAIVRRLDVPVDRAFMVGDDEACDIAGATASGLRPVRCDVWTGGRAAAGVPVIDRLGDLPALLRARLEEDSTRHAA